MSDLCPFCGRPPRNSDDHVFPEFLGGTATIRACKPCNDRFGHSIEGAVSSDLAPLVISLRVAGLRPPKLVVWKRAFKNGIGIDYDLDSNLQAQQSVPLVERDQSGAVKSAYFQNDRMKAKFVAAAKRKGKRVEVVDHPNYEIPIPNLELQVTTSPELRRLAMKMAVGTATYVHDGVEVLDQRGREVLLGSVRDDSRILLDVDVHAGIEELRCSLDHLVYVEGNHWSRRCYGIVELYGFLQLHVVLNDGNYSGQDFAVVGTLGPCRRYTEEFRVVPALELARPTPHYFAEAFASVWGRKFQDESKMALGEGTAFKMSHVPSIPSTWISSGGTSQRTIWVRPEGVKTNEKD